MKETFPGIIKGDRVELIRFFYDPFTMIVDDNTNIPPGTLGTVSSIDDAGTCHINWDNGRNLGALPGSDKIRKV